MRMRPICKVYIHTWAELPEWEAVHRQLEGDQLMVLLQWQFNQCETLRLYLLQQDLYVTSQH
jgi:hypothetical protein